MNRMLKDWLHCAALAAAAFSGQPHWAEIAEPRRRVQEKPIENKTLSGFGPALQAAD